MPVEGEMLNHYRVMKRLGAGGMGEVFLAEDTRFKLDFSTAFATGNARPHGIAMK